MFTLMPAKMTHYIADYHNKITIHIRGKDMSHKVLENKMRTIVCITQANDTIPKY